MRRALVGVLGHVDHGKTALVRALTGTDTDRLPEEKRRGISILPGYARLAADDAELDLVDVPGHERFVRAMVAGAAAMRAALLVVDAREGVRAQTREHAGIAALLGVRQGVVAIARADRAEPAEITQAMEAARALLAELSLEAWPCLSCSALTGDGVAALTAALLALAEPAPDGEPGRAWMPLDRAFHRPGAGLVVTGALRQGRLAVGDEVELWPGPRRATVRGLQGHGEALETARPGRRLAVALRGASAVPGDALASPGLVAASSLLDVRVTALAALRRGEALRLLCGPVEVGARLRLMGGDTLGPGETGFAQLALDGPIAVPVRAGFVLRRPSPPATVAGGVVLDAEAPRRRGRDAALLAAMAGHDAPEAAAEALRAAGPRGLCTERLRRLAGGDLPVGATALTAGVSLAVNALAGLEAALLAAVSAACRVDPLGAGPEARALLRTALPDGAPAEAVAARLAARRELRLAGGRFSLPAAPLLGESERALLAELEALWREAGLAPPEAIAVAAGSARRAAAIRHLVRHGVLLRAPDAVQKREWLFHHAALATARARLAAPLGATPAGLTVSQCNALLAVTRRHGVPILERLDADGFTRRHGDRRVLRDA